MNEKLIVHGISGENRDLSGLYIEIHVVRPGLGGLINKTLGMVKGRIGIKPAPIFCDIVKGKAQSHGKKIVTLEELTKGLEDFALEKPEGVEEMKKTEVGKALLTRLDEIFEQKRLDELENQKWRAKTEREKRAKREAEQSGKITYFLEPEMEKYGVKFRDTETWDKVKKEIIKLGYEIFYDGEVKGQMSTFIAEYAENLPPEIKKYVLPHDEVLLLDGSPLYIYEDEDESEEEAGKAETESEYPILESYAKWMTEFLLKNQMPTEVPEEHKPVILAMVKAHRIAQDKEILRMEKDGEPA